MTKENFIFVNKNTSNFGFFFDEASIYSSHFELLVLFGLSLSLFGIGILGICYNKKNILILMLCIEIVLLSSALNFIIFSILRFDPLGQIYALLIITLAACESAIGLGLLISAYRIKKSIKIPSFANMRG